MTSTRPRGASLVLTIAGIAGCAHAPAPGAGVASPDASVAAWIDDAFDRLPLALTYRGGRRWRVEWHAEQRPYGTGTTDAEIADLETQTIHLYEPSQEPRSKRAVARAVAFSLLWARDVEVRWSSSPEWTAQNGWRGALTSLMSPLAHAENVDPRGFADPRGLESPRADLASFAARYFFPEPNDDVRCRMLSQARFLGNRLELPEQRCSAFERWARLDRIESVEVGLAAPSTRAAASVFGHLLLRVLYRGGESRVIAFVADVPGEIEDDPFYAVKGLFGGYRARLMERAFEDVYRDYVVHEGRDLRRWRLNVDHEEREALFERIWTLERSGAFDYYFLNQNCASLLVALFNSVLPEGRRIEHAGTIGRDPGTALDGLELAHAADGGPLITYVPEPIKSFAREAREAAGRREALALELARRSPEAASTLAAIEGAAREEVRAEAYRQLVHLGLPAETLESVPRREPEGREPPILDPQHRARGGPASGAARAGGGVDRCAAGEPPARISRSHRPIPISARSSCARSSCSTPPIRSSVAPATRRCGRSWPRWRRAGARPLPSGRGASGWWRTAPGCWRY